MIDPEPLGRCRDSNVGCRLASVVAARRSTGHSAAVCELICELSQAERQRLGDKPAVRRALGLTGDGGSAADGRIGLTLEQGLQQHAGLP
jgi:hypothetical protein